MILLAADCARILSTQNRLQFFRHCCILTKINWSMTPISWLFVPLLFSGTCATLPISAPSTGPRHWSWGYYTDTRAEGSHDWDTFTRFYLAGYAPVHVAELLYSWRMHAMSTSSNIDAKPVVFDSQMSVIERFLSGAP